MKPEIKLFFDFEFTSLSPDAQPISLGIVSEAFTRKLIKGEELPLGCRASGNEGAQVIENSKSFYAEFSDFDINRCDNWVKENVVSKLRWRNIPKPFNPDFINNWEMVTETKDIKIALKEWLSKFSEYQITFVCDCGTWDWYWMLQLLAVWDVKCIYPTDISFKAGLPVLPINISPVPEDLNDLIAIKKGISVREAFELGREELMYLLLTGRDCTSALEHHYINNCEGKHNALWDAKVIKSIYEKLKRP